VGREGEEVRLRKKQGKEEYCWIVKDEIMK
jgi:hypothetical protein